MKHKGVTLKNIILLQAIIIIYTVSSVMAKFASANKETPIKFFLFLGLEFAILSVGSVCEPLDGNLMVNDMGCHIFP